MTDADQRPTPKDSAQATAEAEAGLRSASASSEAAPDATPGTPPAAPAPVAEDNPFAPPPEDVPAPPAPWGAPQQPYGQVRPGPVQPWGTQRPRPPEQPTSHWGDPHRYGPVDDPRGNPQNDPDRRYRDQRELDRQPQRRERDLPTRWALGLSVGATICTMLAILQGLATFPAWMVGAAAGLALAIGAFVMSIRAQQIAAARHRRAPEATASLVSSIVTGSLALILLVASIVWFNQFKAYAKCMSGASTQAAQDVCLQQLETSTGMTIR